MQAHLWGVSGLAHAPTTARATQALTLGTPQVAVPACQDLSLYPTHHSHGMPPPSAPPATSLVHILSQMSNDLLRHLARACWRTCAEAALEMCAGGCLGRRRRNGVGKRVSRSTRHEPATRYRPADSQHCSAPRTCFASAHGTLGPAAGAGCSTSAGRVPSS